MTANNIKKLANDEGFVVFNIKKDEEGTYEVIRFDLQATFYWNVLKDHCTHEEAVQACSDYASPNRYPVMLENSKVTMNDVREISKKYISYREVDAGKNKSYFEQYIPETDEWKKVCYADDMFKFVDFVKKTEDNPEKIVVSYVDRSHGRGYTVAGEDM